MSETHLQEVGFGALSVPESARLARVGQSSIWKAIRERHLEARKLGRRTVILKEDAQNYLQKLPKVGAAA